MKFIDLIKSNHMNLINRKKGNNVGTQIIVLILLIILAAIIFLIIRYILNRFGIL